MSAAPRVRNRGTEQNMARPVGRPKKVGRMTTAIRFPTVIHDQLRNAADDRDLSINFLVVQACREFLERLIPVEEQRWTRDG